VGGLFRIAGQEPSGEGVVVSGGEVVEGEGVLFAVQREGLHETSRVAQIAAVVMGVDLASWWYPRSQKRYEDPLIAIRPR